AGRRVRRSYKRMYFHETRTPSQFTRSHTTDKQTPAAPWPHRSSNRSPHTHRRRAYYRLVHPKESPGSLLPHGTRTCRMALPCRRLAAPYPTPWSHNRQTPYERLRSRNCRARQPTDWKCSSRNFRDGAPGQGGQRLQPIEELALDILLCFSRHQLPVDFDFALFRYGDRLLRSPQRSYDFRDAHRDRIGMMIVKIVWLGAGAPLFREIPKPREQKRKFLNHAGGELAFRQHATGRLQSQVNRASSSLSGTDSQEGRLGDDCRVGIESHQP